MEIGCDDACTAWSHWNDLGCSASCDYGTTNRTRNRVCALESCKDEEEAIGHCKTKSCPGSSVMVLCNR